jgi:hypothetical protein
MITTLRKKAKNCIIIRYEDLLYDFNNTMKKFNKFKIKKRKNIIFPINEIKDCKYGGLYNSNKNNFTFTKEMIFENINFINKYEKKLKYID